MTFPSSMTRRAWVCGVLATTSVWAQAQTIVMSSTTSTEQSGLFAHLLPAFKRASGLDVKVVALGTGQALDMARRGDADVVFVHDQVAEEKFVADGFGIKRLPVMYNDFVLIGPKADLPKCRRDIKVTATAALLFRRFYLSNSVMIHDPKALMVAVSY